MKIHVLSDLHFEFHKDSGITYRKSLVTDADVLVLAGDIATWDIIPKALAYFSKKYKHVVYVPGNHEYYLSSPEEVSAILSEVVNGYDNVHWLNDSAVTIEGQRFIGCTLWFRDDPNNIHHQHRLSDFNVIRKFVPWVYTTNVCSVIYLEENVTKDDIVVTHHMPTDRSTPNFFANGPLNRFFVCDMEELIYEARPKMWIHGHTHNSFDYKMLHTRVICNPFGYVARNENRKFAKKLVVEAK
jgi:predicted phosphodiesterase